MKSNNGRRAAMLITLGAMIAGCGGGGGGSVASAPPPPPAPPPATYTKLVDMSGDRTFQSAGVEYDFGAAGFTNSSQLAFGSGVRIAYTASSDSYTLTAPSNATITFGPGDVLPAQPNSPNVISWQKISGTTVDRLTYTVPMVNNVALSYTLVGTWITNQTNAPGGHSRIAVGGAPTISTDMPRSGSATYTSGVGGAALQGGSNYILTGHSSGTFSANFGTGAITTGLTLAGTLTPTDPTVVAFGSFSGTGTIASGGSGYGGTLSGTAANGATATGGFSGGFFGPQALETAFGYSLSAGSLTAVGALVGVKQ